MHSDDRDPVDVLAEDFADRLRLGRRRRSYGGGRLRSFDFPIAILAKAGAEVAALRA